MATLLASHLEQISLCATSIAEMPFAGPKMFTNALLSTHDITSLLRDTEQHERALFHLAPPSLPNRAELTASIGPAPQAAARRTTMYGARQPKNKAVAAVLGGDLYQRTRQADFSGRQKGEIDVEVLLQGAEKLAAVYPMPGTSEKISQLRRRHQQLAANIVHYEARVAEQTRELQAMNRPASMASKHDPENEEAEAQQEAEPLVRLTKQHLDREEEEIRELEKKKKGLEDRVTGMEKDLGGLLR